MTGPQLVKAPEKEQYTLAFATWLQRYFAELVEIINTDDTLPNHTRWVGRNETL